MHQNSEEREKWCTVNLKDIFQGGNQYSFLSKNLTSMCCIVHLTCMNRHSNKDTSHKVLWEESSKLLNLANCIQGNSGKLCDQKIRKWGKLMWSVSWNPTTSNNKRRNANPKFISFLYLSFGWYASIINLSDRRLDTRVPSMLLPIRTENEL